MIQNWTSLNWKSYKNSNNIIIQKLCDNNSNLFIESELLILKELLKSDFNQIISSKIDIDDINAKIAQIENIILENQLIEHIKCTYFLKDKDKESYKINYFLKDKESYKINHATLSNFSNLIPLIENYDDIMNKFDDYSQYFSFECDEGTCKDNGIKNSILIADLNTNNKIYLQPPEDNMLKYAIKRHYNKDTDPFVTDITKSKYAIIKNTSNVLETNITITMINYNDILSQKIILYIDEIKSLFIRIQKIHIYKSYNNHYIKIEDKYIKENNLTLLKTNNYLFEYIKLFMIFITMYIIYIVTKVLQNTIKICMLFFILIIFIIFIILFCITSYSYVVFIIPFIVFLILGILKIDMTN